MLSIATTIIDERHLNRIAINEGKTFTYKNNSCIWMSRKIAFQNCLRIDNFGLRKGRHVSRYCEESLKSKIYVFLPLKPAIGRIL
jgi:hypothetical protein